MNSGWTLGVVYRPPWTGVGGQWCITFWFFRRAIRFSVHPRVVAQYPSEPDVIGEGENPQPEPPDDPENHV